MILVDTSVWIDYFNGADTRQSSQLDLLLDTERLIIGDLIITELLQGFRTDKEIAAVHEIISLLEYRDLVGRKIAEQSAQNYRFLRKKGVTVRKTIDVIIGTFCIENGHFLLHNDQDFVPMQNFLSLKVIS